MKRKSSKALAVQNFVGNGPTTTAVVGPNNDKIVKLRKIIMNDQLSRLRQDISMWRSAVNEMEASFFPHRVKVQQLFQDTVLNGHVSSCMEKRKDLTLLKEFEIVNDKGEESEDLTKLFRKDWFYKMQSYILDARFYGYSLINFYNLENDGFKDVDIIRRANVSPDRKELAPFFYALNGLDFINSDLADWCLYVDTPSDIGVSVCGYGILYKVAPYEIYCRNIGGQNATFVELFGQPMRVFKSSKQEGPERDKVEASVRDMGSSAWAVLDPEDVIEFVEASKSGNGWESYENFEKRCEAKISKLILGHADAMDSTPGKLGSSDGNESPAQIALREKQSSDKVFLECVINDQLIPKMRNLGFKIPEGYSWRIKNDEERREIIQYENKSNKEVADIVATLKNAGYAVDMKWLSDKLGMPIDKAEDPKEKALPADIKNRLKDIYTRPDGRIRL